MPYDVVAFSTDERALLLTLEEEGAFHRILRHAWINGSVPDDVHTLARICRCKSVSQMQKLWPALEPFWPQDPLDNSRRINPKQESEREFKQEKSGKAKESAVKRWESARKAKAISNVTADAMRTHMPTQSEGNAPLPSPPLPVPILKDSSLIKHSPTDVGANGNGSHTYSPDFEIFWTAYPKKTGKGDAWKAWVKLRPSRVLQDIMIRKIGEARASPQWQKQNGEFVPNPATWIRQCRWDDEVRADSKVQSVHDFL